MTNTLVLNRKHRKGFTLIELIVVIAIIAILAAIAIPRFSTVTTSARNRATEANHRILVGAVQMSMAETGGVIPSGADDAAIKAILAPYIEGTLNTTNPPATYTFTGTTAASAVMTLTSVMTGTGGATYTQTWTR